MVYNNPICTGIILNGGDCVVVNLKSFGLIVCGPCLYRFLSPNLIFSRSIAYVNLCNEVVVRNISAFSILYTSRGRNCLLVVCTNYFCGIAIFIFVKNYVAFCDIRENLYI